MSQSKGIFQNELFYIDHLNPDSDMDLDLIEMFRVDRPEGYGLEVYLKEYSCDDEKNKTMRTYLVRYNNTDELVGYFSLKAGLVSVNETTEIIKDKSTGEEKEVREFDTVPGVELADFSVNSVFITKHSDLKGVGYYIFTEFVVPTILSASDIVGIKFIYIFALPEPGLIERYGEYGFRRMSEKLETDFHRRLKPRYDQSCIFMYQLLE